MFSRRTRRKGPPVNTEKGHRNWTLRKFRLYKIVKDLVLFFIVLLNEHYHYTYIFVQMQIVNIIMNTKIKQDKTNK